MGNFSDSELNIIKLAQNGDFLPLFDMAVKYATEEPRDIAKSIEMFEICAEYGSLSAHRLLALLYLEQQNVEKAFENQRTYALYNYEGLPKFVQIAKHLYGDQKGFDLLIDLVNEAVENQRYSEDDDTVVRMVAEVISLAGQDVENRGGTSIGESLNWFEKSAKLGNDNSAYIAMLGRAVHAHTDKVIGIWDNLIEDSTAVIKWAKVVLSSENTTTEEKESARTHLQDGTFALAVGHYFDKNYRGAIDTIRNEPLLNSIPMAQIVMGCAYFDLAKDPQEFKNACYYMKDINNIETWKDINWDTVNKYFIFYGGQMLAMSYRIGVVDGKENLATAYETLQNILLIIKNDEEIRSKISAEMQKYKKSWFGNWSYAG